MCCISLAGQPFPDTLPRVDVAEGCGEVDAARELNHQYTWTEEMQNMLPPVDTSDIGSDCRWAASRIVQPQLIEPIWEPVSACKEGGGGNNGKNCDATEEVISAQYSTCFQGF